MDAAAADSIIHNKMEAADDRNNNTTPIRRKRLIRKTSETQTPPAVRKKLKFNYEDMKSISDILDENLEDCRQMAVLNSGAISKLKTLVDLEVALFELESLNLQ